MISPDPPLCCAILINNKPFKIKLTKRLTKGKFDCIINVYDI
ncbi:hypothetical protein EUBSIR_00631 [[Eubacterium] siraeum DSM 15702]|uniref:Uncharacterized protein n=1 Tax=[Eubacterium] siraeum DSM 15702 TaxID=428128 RepID=B0MLE2_9FIRM|nr:hypothetical protein EUBSIR_00631 [[Eubacterium] siraeum DSM 15702]